MQKAQLLWTKVIAAILILFLLGVFSFYFLEQASGYKAPRPDSSYGIAHVWIGSTGDHPNVNVDWFHSANNELKVSIELWSSTDISEDISVTLDYYSRGPEDPGLECERVESPESTDINRMHPLSELLLKRDLGSAPEVSALNQRGDLDADALLSEEWKTEVKWERAVSVLRTRNGEMGDSDLTTDGTTSSMSCQVSPSFRGERNGQEVIGVPELYVTDYSGSYSGDAVLRSTFKVAAKSDQFPDPRSAILEPRGWSQYWASMPAGFTLDLNEANKNIGWTRFFEFGLIDGAHQGKSSRYASIYSILIGIAGSLLVTAAFWTIDRLSDSAGRKG